jgi:hypothetical protein
MARRSTGFDHMVCQMIWWVCIVGTPIIATHPALAAARIP